MATPTRSGMRTSMEDARFFYLKLDPIVRGPEQGQDLELVRRYFRAYLHCWKCVPHFVREAVGLSGGGRNRGWAEWCERWGQSLDPGDYEVFECLRKARDHDTHEGTVAVKGEAAAGLFPVVMFRPGKHPGPPRELVSCCERGLVVLDRLIREYPGV